MKRVLKDDIMRSLYIQSKMESDWKYVLALYKALAHKEYIHEMSDVIGLYSADEVIYLISQMCYDVELDRKWLESPPESDNADSDKLLKEVKDDLRNLGWIMKSYGDVKINQ